MQFAISIVFQGKNYRFLVREGRRTIAYQNFHVIARNKEVIIQTNLPLHNRRKNQERPDFIIVEGQRISNPFFFRLLCNAIWEKIKLSN